ncbi:unnamed protein product [Rotaria sp. Silwood2]|nr:unnamed protein product [Rotaria sp. Silwood2]CAF4025068.1 unnamed protein product [Rotaria sp. Silwood2]
MCSIAAASRLMSSVSKKSHNSILKESNDTNKKSPLSQLSTTESSSFLRNSSSTLHSSTTNPIIPTPETTDIHVNGYRTQVVCHDHACLRTLDILRQVDRKCVGILFNLMYASRLFQDLESWTKGLIGMHHILTFTVKIIGLVILRKQYYM